MEDESGNIIDVEKTYTYDMVGCVEGYDIEEKELIEVLEELSETLD